MPSVHDSKMCHQCDSRTENCFSGGGGVRGGVVKMKMFYCIIRVYLVFLSCVLTFFFFSCSFFLSRLDLIILPHFSFRTPPL